MEKQYKAITEGKSKWIAILSYSIKVKPEGFLQKTSLNVQVVQSFSINIHSSNLEVVVRGL
jgi:hypothetical protein